MMRSINMTSSTPQMGGSLWEQIKSYKMYILAVLVFVALSIALYFYYIKPMMKPTFKPNNEHMPSDSDTNKTVEIMLFYVDWCPHCKTAKPAWEDVKRQYEDKQVNGYRIIFTEINCTDESPEVEAKMNQYGIEGFPTIKMLKDGQIIEFDAKPTKENLEQFINTVV